VVSKWRAFENWQSRDLAVTTFVKLAGYLSILNDKHFGQLAITKQNRPTLFNGFLSLLSLY